VNAGRAAVVPLAALALACGPATPQAFQVVHHRANGCSPEAPENSLAAVRCVVEKCAAGTAPCALEVDIQLIRLRGGSLGDDLEIVAMHDASTERTAHCPGGALALPGAAPIEPQVLAGCRLKRADGTLTDEPVLRFDELRSALADSRATLFLELKTSEDPALARRLAAAAVERLGALAARTIVTSFDRIALAEVRARAGGLSTACFAPTGHGARQVWSALAGGVLRDLDRCLSDGNDHVFVPPISLSGRVAAHVRHAGARLGVFGADNADGHDAVMRWAQAIDVVYADRPAMYQSSP
jgi:glycerophosphoryl diester phosphodiesterase